MADAPSDPRYTPPRADAGGTAPLPFKRAAHMAIFFTVLIDLIGFGILIPILQPFAKGFGASDMAAILLMGTYSLMQFIFSPILGRISDRIGRRPVIIASLVGSMLGYLIIAAAPFCGNAGLSIALLFLARAVTGICGASFSTAQAALADVTAPEKRAAVMGMIGAAFGIGFVLGPVIGGLTSGTALGPSLPFYIAAAMSLANALYCWKTLPETLPPEKRGTPRVRESLLGTARKMGHTAFPAILVSNFLVITAFSIMTMTFVLFTGKVFGFGERTNGFLFMFIGMIAIFIQGGLIRRIVKNGNERKVAIVGCALMVVGLALLGETGPATEGVADTASWAMLLLVMAAMSVGNSFATPTLNALASQCGTVQTQGETMGAMSSAGSLGRFIGPFMAAGLAGLHPGKYEYAFWLAAIIMAAAVVAVGRIRRIQGPA